MHTAGRSLTLAPVVDGASGYAASGDLDPSVLERSLGDYHARASDRHSLAQDADLDPARAPNPMALLDHDGRAIDDQAVGDEMAGKRACGGPGRRVLGDAHRRVEEACVGGGIGRDGVDAVQVTNLAAGRAQRGPRPGTIRDRTIDGSSGSGLDQQMRHLG
jgi:hypothetical protein